MPEAAERHPDKSRKATDESNQVAESHVDFKSYVEIKGVSFTRGNKRIFDDINIKVPKGKITTIMGPSGTGKTTLLKLVGGQLKPDAGDIFLNGQHVNKLKRKALYLLRENIGMLFQSGALFSDLNVYENVAFPLRVHTKLPETMIHDLVIMKLEAVGLRGANQLMPNELSGGMSRRAALARAIALDPEMVMYDEPFTGQDPIAMGVIVQLIRSLNEALGLTSIVVSHDIQESLSITDYLVIIAEGRVMGQGSPDDLRHHGSAFVKQFLGGFPDGPVPFHYPVQAPYAADLLQGERKC